MFPNLLIELKRIFKLNVIDSFKELCIKRDTPWRDLIADKNSHFYRFSVSIVILSLFFIFPIFSFDFGISGDEHVHFKHANYVVDYFLNGDKSALNQPKTYLHFYGQSFDNITAFLIRWFNIENYYEFRHVLNSLTGVLVILFSCLIVVRLLSYRAALLTILFFLISPRFIAHTMFNPKDIPFAAAYISGIYFSIRTFDFYPKYNGWILLGLLLSVAAAISVRVGGILLYANFLVYSYLYIVKSKGFLFFLPKANSRVFFRFMMGIVPVLIISYFLSLILWPWALQDPLKNPVEALRVMTHYKVAIRQLFEGNNLFSNNLPWYYASKYILISIPMLIILGFGASVLAYKKYTVEKVFLLFTCIFPLVYIALRQSNLYGGWRHLIFIYPSLIIISVWGFSSIYNYGKLYSKQIVMVLILAGSILPLSWEIRNYPHLLPYYNKLVGGTDGAYGNYEMDYYYQSLKEASDQLKESRKFKEKKGEIVIASDHVYIMRYYFRKHKNVKVIYTRYYEKSSKKWDFAIFQNAYIASSQLKKGFFPPYGTLSTIDVDDKPISVVLERKTDLDYLGYISMKEKRYHDALNYFKQYLELNKHNEEVYDYAAKCFSNINNLSSAIKCSKSALSICPEFLEGLNTLGKIYFNNKEYANAIKCMAKIIKNKKSHWSGYYIIGLSHMKLGNYKKAIKAMSIFAANVKNRHKAYEILSVLYDKVGDKSNAKKYYNLARKKK
ncbi:MAG: hypothetical protein N4A59_01000 [Marinifilum sp.]|jgi:tetratricopeptide (TPR) repeat protein|nr:hypothetical protein [Marinifilum sp.]